MIDTSENRAQSSSKECSGEAPEAEGVDPVIEVLKKDVDRTLLIDNLRRTVHERAQRMNEFNKARETMRQAARQEVNKG